MFPLSTLLPALLLSTFAAALPAPTEENAAALDAQFKAVFAAHHAAKAAEMSTTVEVLAADVVMTRNELVEGRCAPIIVIFARGTTEPGNVGDDVGPWFFDELEKAEPGRVIVQGVNNYKADTWGYLIGGSRTGTDDMVASVSLAATQCPDSKIVLSGFSQGAQIVHRAAAEISKEMRKRVGAIVLFGDPFNRQRFPGTLNDNVLTFCEIKDWICWGLPIVTDAHADYEFKGVEAAAWVAALL